MNNIFCYNLTDMEFAERLKELRTEAHESQETVGKVVNMSKMAISHWESGHSEPSISQLKILARHFNVTVGYLVGTDD